MPNLKRIDSQEFKQDMPAFREETEKFEKGEISKKDYKGFSGKYGSYAQRNPEKHMVRLRMTAGQVDPEKMSFAAEIIEKNNIDLVHFTTCQALQFHNVTGKQAGDIIDEALDHDIVCLGGGGDYPRNVMNAPLSGVDPEEYFDTAPYAKEVAQYLLHFVDGVKKMPRKLKVGFSNSPKNQTHATFRDLGFVANPNHTFDVYIAGGLGSNPKLGVKVADNVDPKDVLFYVKAMRDLFMENGNYENRSKARTRYMQDKFETPEALKAAFDQKLEEAKKEDLRLENVEEPVIDKQGDGEVVADSWRVQEQKQKGLYSVLWHPIGGSPNPKTFIDCANAMKDMKDVQMRIAPDETVYFVNLTAAEANKFLEITEDDCAKNEFETSIACIGSTICQVGLRDSQGLLREIIKTERENNLKDGTLPRIHVSGCPSSCGSHQIGALGFRGFLKMVDKKPQPAFMVFENGCDKRGEEKLGKELGAMLQTDIPNFIIDLSKTVEASGMNFDEWHKANPEGIAEVTKKYIQY